MWPPESGSARVVHRQSAPHFFDAAVGIVLRDPRPSPVHVSECEPQREPVLLRERDDRFSSFLRGRGFAAELVELSGEMRGDEQTFRVPDVLSGRQSALGPIEGGIRVAKCPRRARCITRVDHLGRLSG